MNSIILKFTNRSDLQIASVAIDSRTQWLPAQGQMIRFATVNPDDHEIITEVMVLESGFEVYTSPGAGYSEVRYRVVLDTDWKPHL